MSIQMDMVKKQMAAFGPSFNGAPDVAALRAASAASAQMPPVEGVRFEMILLGGRDTEAAIPEAPRGDAVIMYIHGGGYVSGDPRNERAFTSSLAKMSGMTVYGITYRLAPEDPFPAGPEDCLSAYAALAEQYPEKKIFLLGASAGATYVIVTALMARDRGLRLPDGVVAWAACGDLTGELDRSAYKDTDIVIGYGAIDALRGFYCPNDADNPYASCCLASYEGFPPLRIVWDAGEAVSPDCRLIAQKAAQAGVRVESKEWENTFHTFELLAGLIPEAVTEMTDSIAFMNRCIDGNGTC